MKGTWELLGLRRTQNVFVLAVLDFTVLREAPLLLLFVLVQSRHLWTSGWANL